MYKLSFKFFHFSLFIMYLEKEYGNAKIGEYFGGLLHSLEVHDMEDNNKKHYYHDSTTRNRTTRKPSLLIIVSINYRACLYRFPACCKFSESCTLAFNIVTWKRTILKLLWVALRSPAMMNYYNLPLESMNHPQPTCLLRWYLQEIQTANT